MKLNKLFNILLTCILTLGFAACSDDDNNDSGGGGNSADYKYLPNKIEVYSVDDKKYYTVSEVQYDDQGHILKMASQNDDESEYITFKYDAEGRIISHETNEDGKPYTANYTYSDKKVEIKYTKSERDYTSEDEVFVDVSYHETLTLDNNDRLINHNVKKNDRIHTDESYIYDDANLTVTKKESDPSYYDVIKYQKTKGYISDINMPQWYWATEDNYYPEYIIVEEIEYRETTAIEKSIFTYKFNKMNNGKEYPIEITEEEIDLEEETPGEVNESSIYKYKINYKELKK